MAEPNGADRSRNALVLCGGGARAAYQVGAIRALAEILDDAVSPFGILAGVSAGAINTVGLAIGSDDFRRTSTALATRWSALTPDAVYRTDAANLVGLGAHWIKDLTTGGIFGPSRMNYLLDTTPLRSMLEREFDMHRLQGHFGSNLLRGVALSATNYVTGSAVTFFDGAPEIEPWSRRSRTAIRAPLRVEHVLASSAIPMFFPPVEIDGPSYGDGCLRMTTPLSPAIHLGARKIVAIGIRYEREPASTLAPDVSGELGPIPVSAIASVLLNALFLDSLENDLERLERINRTLSVMPASSYERLIDPLRNIRVLALRPSQDLGRLAADQYGHFPVMLRHLLRGIGATHVTGWDLISYLAFDPEYIARLMKLGYEDTHTRRREVEAFFAAPVEVEPSIPEPQDSD